MPDDTGLAEKGAHVGRMREGLPPVSPLLARPPQDLPSVLSELQRIADQKDVLEAQHGKLEVTRTRWFLEEQQGELEVIRAHSGLDRDPEAPTIDQEVSERLAAAKRKGARGVRTVHDIGGKEVDDPQEARKLITEEVLVKRLAGVRRIRDQIDPGRKLTAREFAAIADPRAKGQLYAAELILQAVHPFVVADKTGAAAETYGAVAEFDSRRDEVANLDASAARDKIEEAAKLLPEGDTISTLAATEIGRVYGKASSSPERQSATYLAKAGAEAAERVVNAGTGKRPIDVPFALEETDPRDPSRKIPIDITEMATRTLDGIRTGRADRMYQNDSLSCGDFDRAAEVMSRQAVTREEADRWKLLARFRHYAREGVTVFSGNPAKFKEAAPSLEQAKSRGEPWILPTEDQYTILEDENVRRAIRVYYGIRAGEIVFGGKGQAYKVKPDGSAAEPIGHLSMVDRIALEMLHSWGVHSSPFLEAPVAGETAREQQARELRNKRKQVAWNTYKGSHDGIRRLYPYDKYIEEGNPPLYLEATGTPDFTLILENPDKPGQWFLGDYLQMQGLTPQDLLTKWDEIKRKNQFGKGPDWFWAQIDKGVETSKGWGDLIKEGLLMPETVWQKLGKEAYGYLPAPLKRQILRPLYQLADQSTINLIMTQVRVEGVMKKADLLNMVMTKGLKMFDLYELTGIYFSTVAGTGRVASQIEAMRNAYLGTHPDAVAEADQYVFELTGIRIAEGIPDTYADWRDMVGKNLLRLEGYSGTVDALLEGIKGGKYRYKKTASEGLAHLLLEDPVAKVVDGLMVRIQEKNWVDFQEWLANQHREIGEGKLPPEELIKQMLQKLTQQRGEGFFDAEKLAQAERELSKLGHQESFFSRLKTSDGLFHQRWPTPLSFTFSILPEIPVLGIPFKFLKKPQVQASIEKWLGSNPASVILGTAGWLGYMGVQTWLVGELPFWTVWTSTFWIATLAGSVMTGTMHLVNEHIFQFTRNKFDQSPLSPKKK